MHDWLNQHGDYLYRFALARLRDPHLAEDVVQETFLAAIKSPCWFSQSCILGEVIIRFACFLLQ